MHAIDRPFTQIINGSTQFVIPVFQRDYSWTDSHCEQLWKDVLSIASDPTTRRHFLGSLVYVSTGDNAAGFTRWLLIDGQQRVTTITLLLAALRDHITGTHWKGSEDGPTAPRLDAYFLKNVHEDGARRHKLVLRRRDQATLQALLDDVELPTEFSERVKENYDYFRERLKAADPAVVYRGIGRLVVVDVSLERGLDDAQLIFESLNSTGVALSQSDLIRNFILMRLPEPAQTRLYDRYWNKVEQLFRGSESTFDAFIRDFLALDTRASKQERAHEIYVAFRREFGGIGHEESSLEPFLERMLRSAGYHAAFSTGSSATPSLRAPLARLRHLVDVPAILVMRLFECHLEARTLTESGFVEALTLIESYIFRRAVCGEQTRGYWQVFANIAYQLDSAKPIESLQVGLARQHDSYRFPSDEEFRRALEERDMYGKRICFDLLERLENADTNEPSDTSRYSIEHIMPQNPNLISEWREMLGSEWREVHRVWLHRLGNLTLTGYNSKYSDKPFEAKKAIKDGFCDSAVRLNRFVRDQDKWTPIEMGIRGRALALRALQIWPRLNVDQRLVDAAKEIEMRELARRRDVAKVKMDATARQLFESLRSELRKVDEEVIELAEQHSVSYHAPGFFMEVLPRRQWLNLLLNLQFNEIEDPSGIAQDASERTFFVNAQHEGGVTVRVRSLEDIENALPMIRRAHARAAGSQAAYG